jgi:hypothetical protein
MPKAIEQDQFVPDPQVCREFGITAMTLWRWDHDPDLGFAPRIQIRGKNYRSRKHLEEFKQRMVIGAIAARAKAAG